MIIGSDDEVRGALQPVILITSFWRTLITNVVNVGRRDLARTEYLKPALDTRIFTRSRNRGIVLEYE